MHVLIIDDERAIREILTELCRRAGYSVDQASTCAEAAAKRFLDDRRSGIGRIHDACAVAHAGSNCAAEQREVGTPQDNRIGQVTGSFDDVEVTAHAPIPAAIMARPLRLWRSEWTRARSWSCRP